jgi:hypothetical protein
MGFVSAAINEAGFAAGFLGKELGLSERTLAEIDGGTAADIERMTVA